MDMAENRKKKPKETSRVKHGEMKGRLTQKGRQEKEHNEKLLLYPWLQRHKERRLAKEGRNNI